MPATKTVRTFPAPKSITTRLMYVTEYSDGRYVMHPEDYDETLITEEDVCEDPALRHLFLHEIETILAIGNV